MNDLAVKPFRTQQAWESWLAKNHDRAPGIWVKLAKKASGIPTVTYEEAVESALCYGWIDGLTRSLDVDYYVQRFTPRRAKSNWSKSNVSRAEALIVGRRRRRRHVRRVVVLALQFLAQVVKLFLELVRNVREVVVVVGHGGQLMQCPAIVAACSTT